MCFASHHFQVGAKHVSKQNQKRCVLHPATRRWVQNTSRIQNKKVSNPMLCMIASSDGFDLQFLQALEMPEEFRVHTCQNIPLQVPV